LGRKKAAIFRAPHANDSADSASRRPVMRKNMIYIEEKTFERQIDLLGYLSELDAYYICAWLYPESNVTSIVSQKVDPIKLEPVTTYGDGIKPKHTQLVPCSKKIT